MEAIDKIELQLNSLIEEIKKESEGFQNKMKKFKNYQEFFRFTILVLSILTPAFITYYSFSQKTDTLFGLIAIIITALGGSIATLQSQFNFSEKYIRNANNYLNTDDLSNKTIIEYERLNRLNSSNKLEAYHQYLSLLEHSRKELINIRRADIQAEIQLVKERKPIEINKDEKSPAGNNI